MLLFSSDAFPFSLASGGSWGCTRSVVNRLAGVSPLRLPRLFGKRGLSSDGMFLLHDFRDRGAFPDSTGRKRRQLSHPFPFLSPVWGKAGQRAVALGRSFLFPGRCQRVPFARIIPQANGRRVYSLRIRLQILCKHVVSCMPKSRLQVSLLRFAALGAFPFALGKTRAAGCYALSYPAK